jgi:thiol:disulfide interchange protein DsbD
MNQLRNNVVRTLVVIVSVAIAVTAGAQGFRPEPVFGVGLEADQTPIVAGDELRLAVVVDIDEGWHINTDDPGDEFMVPTSLEWQLPEGWPEVVLDFPKGEEITFDFSDTPLSVWEEKVVLVGTVSVPADAVGAVSLAVSVTAQACNNSQCLPPLAVKAGFDTEIAAAGASSQAINQELFSAEETTDVADSVISGDGGTDASGDLADRSLLLFLIGVFLAGLALNLTPCVFPLIPITVGFFAQQAKNRSGGTFWMAFAYVMGIAVTYSVLGVVAALTGQLFGSALQSPWVVGSIVLVLLGLAASMFGLWEFKTPDWAHKAAGARGGIVGSLLMGLVMGFVAAPCIGPFVLGLLTYVGQKGDPVFGFFAFFTLALGLGLPYLLLGTFTGAVNRLPMSGMWMVGVRRVFGVILIAMAAYFAAPLMPGNWGAWLLAATLVLGGLYLLVIDRTGSEQPGVDRVMRLLTLVMVVVGLWLAPFTGSAEGDHLQWQSYDASAVDAAIGAGGPVILDFAADWCVPCRELDEKTFADPQVAAILNGYARFKIDQTRQDDEARSVASKFEVRGVPTVIVFAEGREVFRITGFERAERFLKRLP